MRNIEMATPMGLAVVYAVLAVLLTANNATSTQDDDSEYCTCNEASINRGGFPDGFIFGSSSAAYQVEGAYNVNGKGLSMWDHFTHAYPEKIQDHTNGDVAVDSYHLYKEDVQILKDMGVDAYRFSISWPRTLPGRAVSGGVNQDGIDYYNNLINELLANGIQPWVTILHLDTPQALEDAYGGFLSAQIVSDFQVFADILFSQFGDRVKHWITINEPWCFSYAGYTLGVFAPGRCSHWIDSGCIGGDSATEPYKVTHNQLLAHAAVVNLYQNKYQEQQKGKIGITVNSHWFVLYNQTYESVKTKDRAFDFMLGWVMDPITFGRYPESMRSRVRARLPEFTEDEAEMVKGSFDFVGVNYYSAKYAVNMDQPTVDKVSYITDSGYFASGDKDGIPIGEQGSNGSRYNIYPKGLRLILQHIKIKYNDPVIYITENGNFIISGNRSFTWTATSLLTHQKTWINWVLNSATCIKFGLDENTNDSLPMSEALKDYKRKNYFFDHLCCLHEAIKEDDGANVKGYFTWALTDNFEWISGYLVGFGIHYVDFRDKSLRRHPKLSAKWLKSIFARTTEISQTRRVSDH